MSEFISETGRAAKGRALTKNECRMIELEYRQWADNEIKELRARVAELEGSIKNAIGWIDGDLRELIRDVGNQICSYNDLYESAARIEYLLSGTFRQQADDIEKEDSGDEH